MTTRRIPVTATGLSAAYLDRLGVASEPPSPGALRRLHRAQVSRIPYETLWLHLGEPWGIGGRAALRRLATTRRGGYCFHLNGALALVLRDLGYEVTHHVAGVHDTAAAPEADLGNHVALVVAGLPSEDNPQGRWWVDAGLGDGPLEPVPLRPGVHRQGDVRLTLTAGPAGAWHVATGGTASFAGVTIAGPAVPLHTFAARHAFNRTSPASRFARTVTAQRRHTDGTSVLRGCVLTRTDRGGARAETAGSRDEWLAMLADEFGLVLDTVAPSAVDRLWAQVREQHTAWAEARVTA